MTSGSKAGGWKDDVRVGLLAASPVVIPEPAEIIKVTTLSARAGYLGEVIRNDFKPAGDQASGTLGGARR